jgi:hypothetical protein
VRRAAEVLIFEDPGSWLLPKEALFGKGLKSTLPWKKPGLLSANECKYLASKFDNEAKSWETLCHDIEVKESTLLRTLHDRIQAVGKALKPASEIVDRTIGRRVKVLYPENKKERAKIQKVPVMELIQRCDALTFCKNFNPCMLGGHFTFDPTGIVNKQFENIDDYSAALGALWGNWYRTRQFGDELGGLVQAWWECEALPRLCA